MLSPTDDVDDASPSRRLDFVDGRDASARRSAAEAKTPVSTSQSQIPLSDASLGAVTSSEQRASRQQVTWGANETNEEEEEEEEEDETEEEGPGNDDGDDSAAMQDDDSGAISDNDEDSSMHVVSDDQHFDDDASRGRVHTGDIDGGRRSRRTRYPPLAYWKNERFVYERPNNAVGEVLPTIAGVSERSKTPVAPNRSVAVLCGAVRPCLGSSLS